MDKLVSLSQLNTRTTPKKKKTSKTEKNDKKKRFSRLVKSESNQISSLSQVSLNGDETVEDLLDDLTSAGDRLKDDAGLNSLTEYKKCVKLFISFVLENGLSPEKQAGILNPRTMEQKQYTLIRIVDEKLEKLAAHVMSQQSDQLDILRRVEEINGLLVDLLH